MKDCWGTAFFTHSLKESQIGEDLSMQDLIESRTSTVKTQNPNHRPPGNSIFFFFVLFFLSAFLPHSEFSTDTGALSFLGIVAMRL